MKFILFTPITKLSAISSGSVLISRTLIEKGHFVTIISTEVFIPENQGHCFDFGTNIIFWKNDNLVLNAIREADILVYQVSGNAFFHVGALHWLEKLPGIVILHDFLLENLFWAWAYLDEQNLKKAKLMLSSFCEDKIVEKFFISTPENFIGKSFEFIPILERICSMAGAILTHSSSVIDRIKSACQGPISIIPVYHKLTKNINHQSLEKKDSSPFCVLTIGDINTNRRIESVIKAIGSSEILRKNIIYRLVGRIESQFTQKIMSLADNEGVKLIISGVVSEKDINDVFFYADIVTFLDWPELDESIDPLIEALMYVRPILVSNTALHKEVPDECVLKIELSDEVSNIRNAIEFLYNNEEARIVLCKNAGEWVKKNFPEENRIMKELIKISNLYLESLPAQKAINNIMNVYSKWLGCNDLEVSKKMIEPLRIFEKS